MKELSFKIGVGFLILILIFGMTLFAGIRGSSDHSFETRTFAELDENVDVYRDELGVPTIIGNTLHDLVFIQGYEFARDRTFQLEFYRALINGELSTIFGVDFADTDKMIRTVGLKRAAEAGLVKLTNEEIGLASAYVEGINKFYDLHPTNVPFELQILGVHQQPWTITDTIAMGSIVAFTFAFGGLSNEITRVKTIQKLGMNKSLEIYPVDYLPAKNFLLDLNTSIFQNENSVGSELLSTFENILSSSSNEILRGLESNNWVISGSKSASGHPIVANDPHTSLEAQGLWYRVNMQTRDGEILLQGLTFPGTPLLAFGHNKHLAWGVTNGMVDSVDLFYLKENGTHYLVNDTVWIPFTVISDNIPIKGKNSVPFTIRISEFGPMVETDLGEYAMMWTLTQDIPRENSVHSLIKFNTAESIEGFHQAQENMLTGFNWVVASINGDIAYQQTGIIPKRSYGYGLVPKNGSTTGTGWDGYVDFNDQLYVLDPEEGYFATANERVDTRENFYISEVYAHRYRNDRIEQVLENGTNFEIDTNAITLSDMQQLQSDELTLVAEDLLEPVLPVLNNFVEQTKTSNLVSTAINYLENWDHIMDKESIAATIFATFRIFLIDETFGDEMGELAKTYSYTGVRTLANIIHNSANMWFNDTRTDITETAEDVILRSINRTVNYLTDLLGPEIKEWHWGTLHEVYLPHTLSSITTIFDIGHTASGGSTFTVNAISGPTFDGEEITYTSSYGPYFRMVIEVEPTWSNAWGSVSSGASGNPLNSHYSDSYETWINFEYQQWYHQLSDVQNKYILSAQFRSN